MRSETVHNVGDGNNLVIDADRLDLGKRLLFGIPFPQIVGPIRFADVGQRVHMRMQRRPMMLDLLSVDASVGIQYDRWSRMFRRVMPPRTGDDHCDAPPHRGSQARFDVTWHDKTPWQRAVHTALG
ncbi:MAG: hypothetical protein EA424_28135 [Planctomycetaceae bacterium]|nr:MAG: hypothetical protein EA424_28135 [Planctomycetaceae bacterium]